MKVSRIAALLFISFTGLSRAAEPLHHFNTSSVDHLIILAGDGGAGGGLAPIFPYTFYHLTHHWFAAADIHVANDIPVHYADAIRCNVR
ncbi:hypothetical protein J1780_08720, partial [Rahnella aceris]|uniref:hypothetical protein n=1 Tax=Rahnella sp. (strain Y9602) TaxID=2703885 RepID=UPI001C25A248